MKGVYNYIIISSNMKKICIILLAITLMPFFTSAQNIVLGNLAFLKGQNYVDFNVDFSQAGILGMSEKEIAVQEKDWWKDRHIYVGRFLESLNAKLNRKALYVGKHENASYNMTLVARQVEKNGNILSEIIFTSKTNPDECLCKIIMNASGGTFGTFLNLLGDGMENTGKALGKFIYSKLK